MRVLIAALIVCCVAAVCVSPAAAATAKTYQVTGPVLSVTADIIVIQKGNDKWEIARDANTKITGDLKVGAKVTIQYRMIATAVEVKAETGGKK